MTATNNPFHIECATTREDYDIGRNLFQEYAASLSIDLCFQRFSAELAAIDSMYGPPSGELLLAHVKAELAGCVAIRRYADDDPRTAELKRLYVRETARGLGLGRALVEAALARAEALGYSRVVLDTLPEMQSAQAIYRALGFVEIAEPSEVVRVGLKYFAREL
jgi:putative acetyltransferase